MSDSNGLFSDNMSGSPAFQAIEYCIGATPRPDVDVNSTSIGLLEAPVAETPTASAIDAEATVRQPQNATPRGLPPKPASARFDTLDIVRGVACIMLMVYHASFYADHTWVSGDRSTWTIGGLAINLVGRLWIGVPMFFVVSGYCIAASIDSLRRKPHSLSNYFYRRMRRIYPPLWGGFVLAIILTLIVGLSATLSGKCLQLPRLATFSPMDWLANFSATASWLPKLGGGDSNYLLPNTWTLCYEEQFYIVTGILLTIASRRFFIASYLIAVGTVVARHVCRYYNLPIDGFFFDGHWLLFVCGILLYQRINYLHGSVARWAIAVLAIGAVYGLAERVLAVDPHDRHVGEYILVACTFAICLSFLKQWDKQISSHWSLAPLRWSGKRSYSLYLTHFPITVFVASVLAMIGITRDSHVFLLTIPVCLLLSFPLACVFYHYVEKRFSNAS